MLEWPLVLGTLASSACLAGAVAVDDSPVKHPELVKTGLDLLDDRIHADGLERLHTPAGSAALLANRSASSGASDLLRLCRDVTDRLSTPNGQQDRRGAEHIRGYPRVRTRCTQH